MKKFDKAVEHFRLALRLDPVAFVPHLNYGITLLQMKDYAGAATELQHAARKDNTSASAHLNLGKALIYLGNYDYAEKELQQVIQSEGEEVVEAHRYLGAVYIEKGDNSRAVEALEKYLSLMLKAQDADQIRKIVKELRSQSAIKQ